MNTYAIVTINPGIALEPHKVIALNSRIIIEKVDGKEFIKVNGMVLESFYNHNEAVNFVGSSHITVQS